MSWRDSGTRRRPVFPIVVFLCLTAPAFPSVIASAWIQEVFEAYPVGPILDSQYVVDPISAFASASAFGGQSHASAGAGFSATFFDDWWVGLGAHAFDNRTGARAFARSAFDSWFAVMEGPAEGFLEYHFIIEQSPFVASLSRLQGTGGHIQGCRFGNAPIDPCPQIALVETLGEGGPVVRIPYVRGVPFHVYAELSAAAGGTLPTSWGYTYWFGEADANLRLGCMHVFDSAGNLSDARIGEVPEPSTALLAACGALLLLVAARVRPMRRFRR